jgi:hypothetical protein
VDDDQKEILKVGAEAAMKPFASLIERLFGGAVDEIGTGWAESLRARRLKRQAAVLNKVQMKIETAKFEPVQIPDYLWVPCLQEALLQDDETLQDIWANLLTNAADPHQTSPVVPSFTTVLKELTSRDVKLLDAIYQHTETGIRRNFAPLGAEEHNFPQLQWREILRMYAELRLSRQPKITSITEGEWNDNREDFEADARNFRLSMETLIRNKLLEERIPASRFLPPNNIGVATPAITCYYRTDFGMAFVAACRAPQVS